MDLSLLDKQRAYLGVERSLLGRPWRDRLDLAGQARAQAMMQLHGHSDLLARVLAGRGVLPDEAALYLDPTLRRLMPDPHVLADMEPAAQRLAAAIENNEMIAIFGDYDVDGACSSALLADFLSAAGISFRIHIPDRIFEGYGPNVPAIAALAEEGAKLLVTVDCGTMSHQPLAEAK
ncbi:MAG TPA: DHH family phosphoesterase, partial [Methylovirgula sp.]|nr:DHH family phosphoesterase [Methylovirgula sp.]